MKILVLGVNHKTASVDIRERLAFSGNKLEEGILGLRSLPSVKEVAVLSTCNRVELYTCVDNVPAASCQIKDFLSGLHDMARSEFETSLFALEGPEAVRHVFRVASSLDSMVLGEPQILGQIKDAFNLSLSKKTTGVLLNKLMKKAISTAKRVRTETRIAENAVSISFAAVELARKIFTNLADKSVMLMGAGEMAELAARHLLSNGVTGVMVVNRTYERGCELASEFNGRPVRFEDFLQEMVHADIIICSTGAPAYVLHREQMLKIMKERKQKPVFIIDISVPRNIDPEINKIDNVYLYDVDNLQDVVDTNLQGRRAEADKAEGIIREEVEKFGRWMSALHAVPTIVALRQKADEIRREELEKFQNRFPALDGVQMKAVDYLATAIVNKLIHPPTIALKDDSEDRDELIALMKRLYGINGDEE